MQTEQTKPVDIDPSAAVLPGNGEGFLPENAKKKKRVKRMITLSVIVVAVVLLATSFLRGGQANKFVSSYVFDMAAVRDITVTLSGSATLQPADSYVVSTLVSGEVIGADFEEGEVRKSTRMNTSPIQKSRMPSSA